MCESGFPWTSSDLSESRDISSHGSTGRALSRKDDYCDALSRLSLLSLLTRDIEVPKGSELNDYVPRQKSQRIFWYSDERPLPLSRSTCSLLSFLFPSLPFPVPDKFSFLRRVWLTESAGSAVRCRWERSSDFPPPLVACERDEARSGEEEQQMGHDAALRSNCRLLKRPSLHAVRPTLVSRSSTSAIITEGS